MPPAPTMPRMAHSEKLVSRRMPAQATIWEKEAGRIALKKTLSRLAPVASSASMVSLGMLSKLWAKDLVKKAVVWTHSPATPASAPIPRHTSISSTHTGVGTARRKVKKDWVATESHGIRNTFRAASIPNPMPRSRLYSRDSTAMETVSTREDAIRSMLEKSRWASSQKTPPMSGTRESIFPQSISR